jgi:hypothetical protein
MTSWSHSRTKMDRLRNTGFYTSVSDLDFIDRIRFLDVWILTLIKFRHEIFGYYISKKQLYTIFEPGPQH